MVDEVERRTLSESAARQLANATKTRAQWGGITPRWLVNFLTWTPVEAGIFRLNKVRERPKARPPTSSAARRATRNPDLPETYVDYVEAPREYFLKAVTTVLDVQTRVSDLYSQPFDQVQEQLRLLIEKVKEKQESELINNAEYGLLASAVAVAAHPHPQGPADAGRSRRVADQGLEGAGLLPRPSARHRRLRPRMHPPRRAAADRHPVRDAVHHLARRSARAFRQGQDRGGERIGDDARSC